jgi:hypothetical protein
MLAKNTRLTFECPKRLRDLTRTADPAVRFCDACQKHVFNLSALTEAEVLAVQAAHGCDGQTACIAFAVRGEEILVQPGPPRSATRIMLALAAAGLVLPAGAAWFGFRAPDAPVDAPHDPLPGAAALLPSVEPPDTEALAAALLAESGRLARNATAPGSTAPGSTAPGEVRDTAPATRAAALAESIANGSVPARDRRAHMSADLLRAIRADSNWQMGAYEPGPAVPPGATFDIEPHSP